MLIAVKQVSLRRGEEEEKEEERRCGGGGVTCVEKEKQVSLRRGVLMV